MLGKITKEIDNELKRAERLRSTTFRAFLRGYGETYPTW